MKVSTLRDLLVAGTVGELKAVGAKGGFFVRVSYSGATGLLATGGGKPKCFASLNTLANFLSDLGINRFVVDSSTYEAGLLRKPRPDRAAAMRMTRTQTKLEL